MKKLTKKITTIACSVTALCALAIGGVSAINVSAANTNFTMLETASVRVDQTGIRFSCTVNESYLSGLTKTGGEYEGYTAELGTVIVPTVVLGGNELTATQTYTYNETAYETLKIALTKKDANKSTASVGYYNAVVIDIPAISYETDLSARSYIKLTKGETTEYVYTDVTAVRSIGYVAVEAYNDANTSAEQKEGLKKLLDANLGTIGFDKATYEVAAGEEIAYQVTGNEYGFVLDSEALTKNNAIITSNNTNVAAIENGKIVGVAAGEAEITVKIGEKTAKATVAVKAIAKEMDSTNKFSWDADDTTSVVQTINGYEIRGVGGMKVTYEGEFTLPDGELLNLQPLTSNLDKVIFTFTDATDSTKGFRFAMFNGVGWGANGANVTYLSVHPLGEITSYVSTARALSSDAYRMDNTSAQYLNYYYNIGNKQMTMKTADGGIYTTVGNALSENPFAAANTTKAMKVTIEFVGNATEAGIVLKTLGSKALGKDEKTDSTGMFSWSKNDTTTSVIKTNAGYEIRGVGGMKVTYEGNFTLPDGELLNLQPLTSNLDKVIFTFTDATDATKGFRFAMFNGVDWGGPGVNQTYLTVHPLGEIKSYAANARILSGADYRMDNTSAQYLNYYYNIGNKQMTMKTPDGGIYTTVGNALTENPFAASNTTKAMKVTIEFIGNTTEAGLLIKTLGKTNFMAA